MNSVVIIIHVLAVVILVLSVLLQAGKGAGMGAAFGGSSGSVFGARGPATFIGKITCAAAVVFMCTSLFLTINKSGLRTESVMSDYVDSTPDPEAGPIASAPLADPGADPAE